MTEVVFTFTHFVRTMNMNNGDIGAGAVTINLGLLRLMKTDDVFTDNRHMSRIIFTCQ